MKKNLPPGPVMVDVAGLTLAQHEIERLQHPQVGGVILFSRNFSSIEQLRALTTAIHAARSEPLLIAVDHEGGRVQRFREGFTRLPAMRVLGELWQRDVLQATKAATAVGYVLAAELRACGVDFSFTPVLDLDYGQSSVIGDRAFDTDPRVVTLLAKSLNHGLLLAGMHNCGKHFPGHGFVAADSHVALPVDQRPLAQIMQQDAAPYDWLGNSLSAVMPAHVIYSKVDAQPAGFSKIWLQKILRQQLGFEGVIFSDDLSMEGATAAGDIIARAQAALGAGCDMVLVCNAPEQADLLLQGLDWKLSARSQQRLRHLYPQSTAPALEQNADYRTAKKLIQSLA